MRDEQTKHTPGPWLCVDNGDDSFDYDVLSITTEDRVYRSLVDIARVPIGYDEPLEAEQKANAALMTASPDLLAALVETLAIATRNEEGDFADRARAAIAKATP